MKKVETSHKRITENKPTYHEWLSKAVLPGTNVPPTLGEVRDYCLERKNSVNPETWLAHYEAVNWKIGTKKMVNWQASIRTWEQNGSTTFKKLDGYNDQELIDELKRRGYTGNLGKSLKF